MSERSEFYRQIYELRERIVKLKIDHRKETEDKQKYWHGRLLRQRKELKRLNKMVLEQRGMLQAQKVAKERRDIEILRLKRELEDVQSTKPNT